MQNMNLTQHFLIAMPAMADPHFARSLTFICEHNDRGALGIVINRPIEMNLQTLLEQVSIPLEGEGFKSVPVHFGGPVQVDRGFVLHAPLGQWQSTLAVSSEIGLTTSKDILQAVARGEEPARYRLCEPFRAGRPRMTPVMSDTRHSSLVTRYPSTGTVLAFDFG